jgi:hypothetical protein
MPNYVHSGPSKISGIISHLRQIDAAKQQWAIDHGITNAMQLNRELTTNELAPYLLASFVRRDFGDPICSERYFVKRLNETPEAELTQNLREHSWPSNWKLPKGTTIILVGYDAKYFLPGQESKPPKSLSEVFAGE